MRLLSGIAVLALCAPPARASDLLDFWSYETYAEGASMVGVDGWVGGFEADLWYGFSSSTTGSSYVYSSTDNNETDYPGDWGEGGALDNWLVNGEVVIEDGVVRAISYTEDDDTVGLICRFEDAGNFVLFLMIGEGGTSPLDGLYGPVSAIVKVTDGVAELLGSTEQTYTSSSMLGLELACDEGRVQASVWQTYDEYWSGADFELLVSGAGPRAAGGVGFYAYDAGGYSDAETFTVFGAVHVLAIDEDEDGVADDADNCEEAANADQSDRDGDRLGDACDEAPGDTGLHTGDTGAETGLRDTAEPDETAEPAETDRPEDSGGDTDAPDPGEVEDSAPVSYAPGASLDEVGVRGAWGCAQAPVAALRLPLALAALLALGRRRRR